LDVTDEKGEETGNGGSLESVVIKKTQRNIDKRRIKGYNYKKAKMTKKEELIKAFGKWVKAIREHLCF